MKAPLATAVHVIAVITIATTLVGAYGLISVYLLGRVDSKFGAAGTVQLLGVIALLCSGVAATGSGLFHYFWLRKNTARRRAFSLWSAAVVGTLLAVVHKPLLFNMPIVPGIRDWPQYCLYFLVLGYILHWVLVLLMNVFGARHSVAADRPEAGV